MVVEISLTKNRERKKKEQIKGKTNRRMPIFNPTIQLVVVNLYTKYRVSIFNGCGDIFDENFGKKKKRNKQKEEQIGECPLQSDNTTRHCGPVYQI